jgi:SAM-dependent methyltransferase
MNPHPIDATDFSPAYFERMAALEDSHPWTSSMRKLTLALLRRHRFTQQRRMLDVGCGTGRFLRDWQTMTSAEQWVGIDLFPEALTLARDRCDASLSAASAAALPFAAASFEAIHCADVLQHMSLADCARALDELARALVPGGVLALRVRGAPSFRRGDDRDYSHSFTPDSLKSALGARNFEILFLSRVNALPSLWAEVQERRGSPHAASAPVKHIVVRPEGDARSRLLRAYLAIERAWVSISPFGLPCGHTIVCIARRNGQHRADRAPRVTLPLGGEPPIAGRR